MKSQVRKLGVGILAAALGLVMSAPIVPAASPFTNPNLESLFFVDRYANTVVEPDGRDDVIPYVVVSKKEGVPEMSGTALVAAYDASGTLSQMQMIDINSDNSVFDEKAVLLDRWTLQGKAMHYPEGGYAKAFWWDSVSGMMPHDTSIDDAMAPEGSTGYVGELVLPEPYQSLIGDKFSVRKEAGVRNYSHDAAPEKVYDWSKATEIFISTKGAASNADGTRQDEPITMPLFEANFNSGVYAEQKDFIFTLTQDYYKGDYSDAIVVGARSLGGTAQDLSSEINALIRSGSPSGFTWMGRLLEEADFANPFAPDNGIYKATLARGQNVVPANFKTADTYGMPNAYNLVATLDECKASEGTYYQADAGAEFYVHLFDGDVIEDIQLQALIPQFVSPRKYIGTLMFEDVGFMPNTLNDSYNTIIGGDYDNTLIGFFGCKFWRGAHNALSLQEKYTAVLFDCVNAYGARDGFNYHAIADAAADKYSTMLEINCTSYKHGSFNQIYGAEQDSNSNNASTGHDGMNVCRIGGRYWQTEGPIAADGNCFTIDIGVECYNFVTSSPSDRTAFLSYNGDTSIRGGKAPNKYFIDCLGTGVKIRAGFVGSENTYTLDLAGNTITGLDASSNPKELKKITWEEIAAGGIKMYEGSEEPEDPDKVRKHYNALEDMSGEQGSKCWYYNYAPMAKYAVSDYVPYEYYGDRIWMYEKDNYMYGRIRLHPDIQTLDPGNLGDSALTFAAPAEGTVQISVADNIIMETGSSDVNRLRIYKNETQIFPAAPGEWLTLKKDESYTFEPMTVDVAKGDSIIFRINKGAEEASNANYKNDGDKMKCIPVIDYTHIGTVTKTLDSISLSGVKTAYHLGEPFDYGTGFIAAKYDDGTTQNVALSNSEVTIEGFDTSSAGNATVTVSYGGKSAQYQITVAGSLSTTHYNALDDMSGTQGAKCWYYRGAPVGKYALSDYVDFEYYSSGFWLLGAGNNKYGRIRMGAEQSLDAGNEGDSALTFAAPVSGTIQISMANDGVMRELSSNDIHRFRIYKNEEVVFPKDGSWLEFGAGDTYNFEPMVLEISAGDKIIFRMNKGSENPVNEGGISNEGDKLACIPVIDYTQAGN